VRLGGPSVLLPLAACLIACSSGTPATSQAPIVPAVATITGLARAGNSVISGATVRLSVASSSGGAARQLGQATTDSRGAFILRADCASAGGSGFLYAIIDGGRASAGNGQFSNGANRLVAVLGPCNQIRGTMIINELTTIAAAYALAAFVNGNDIGGPEPGLSNAMATAATLVDTSAGALASDLPSADLCAGSTPPINCETVAKLKIVARAVAACSTSAAASSLPCELLLTCAVPGAIDSGIGPCTPPLDSKAPMDIWQALLAIARGPGLVSASGLYRAGVGAADAAPLTSAPNDWSLSLSYRGGGLSEPTAIAIDAAGDIWVANYNSSASEFGPTGVALSPAAGFTGGGLEESFGIVIDAAGHIWVCNEQSDGKFNSGLGSITELGADGSILSGADGFAGGGLNFPQALAVDATGNIWVTNYGDSTLSEFASDGSPLSPSSGFAGGGLSFPVGLAFTAGNLWVANQGANQISSFSTTGSAVSPTVGFQGGGLMVPQGIATDASGHIWVSNYYGDSLSAFDSHGTALSPGGGYVGGGLAAPGSIAVDGAGQIWVANFQGASLTELSGAGSPVMGSALTSSQGLSSREIMQPFALAIDASGNVWVSNFGNDSLTKFIGIATPVVTPQMGSPRQP